MSSKIQLMTNATGGNIANVPVQIELFDQNLKLVAHDWMQVNETKTYEVEPGLVGVRASLASGAVIDQSVRVEPDQTEACNLDLSVVSPHESQQWAYLTQPIDAPGKGVLSNKLFEGVWMRLWKRGTEHSSIEWDVVPIPINDRSQATWNEEGVTYRFRTPDEGLYVLQVGGPKVAWKNVAIPSTYEAMVLVRPAPDPASVHPLDVVVSSGDGVLESLLTLMQRSDLTSAKGLVDQTKVAEQLLYSKYENTDAAAVGGYFLLRTRDLDRLHSWAANLAESFRWMADGPVIHAWQIILGSKQEMGSRSSNLDQARSRLIEAVSRGFPIYSEGLRLLRDGLLYFDGRAKGEDTEIADAVKRIGDYTVVADWSSTNTTFTGKNPDEPSAKSRKGTPQKKESLIYVFDVPLREVLRRANVKPNEMLKAISSQGETTSQVNLRGEIEFDDGNAFKSLGAAQKYITGDSRDAWDSWRSSKTDQALSDAATSLRIQSKVD